MPTLPNPGMSFTPFDPLPAADLNDMVENIEAIADLSVFANGDIPYNLIANIGDDRSDYVKSGIVWSADAAGSSLNASMTAGVVYIGSVRVPVSLVTAKAFTASRDTYVDIGVDGVVDYNAVTNGSAAPALAANHIRVAKIVTGANIAAASSIVQYGIDSLSNPIKPTGAIRPANMAPAAYSTDTEVLTGETWVDGRPIYRKVLRGVKSIAVGNNTIAHGISGISSTFEVLRVAGGLKLSVGSNNGSQMNLLWHRESGGNWTNPQVMDATNLTQYASFAWGNTWYTFVLEYVK